MGIELVEGQDLFVAGQRRVHADHAGPQAGGRDLPPDRRRFPRPEGVSQDSALGVSACWTCTAAGRVTLANAIGTGRGRRQVDYPFVPDMIAFYLARSRCLPTCRPTSAATARSSNSTLEAPAAAGREGSHNAGGYGMLIGPSATREELDDFGRRLRGNPNNYIAQPTLALSTCPDLRDSGVAPRHIDLRPFVLSGARSRWCRASDAALRCARGSLVVNSSRAGYQDTWSLAASTGTDAQCTADTCSGCPLHRAGREHCPDAGRGCGRHRCCPCRAKRPSAVGRRDARISELQPAFDARFGKLKPRDVLDFMVRDPGNQSSIYCCLQAARENARAVRGTWTNRVWETHNDTWLQLQPH